MSGERGLHSASLKMQTEVAWPFSCRIEPHVTAVFLHTHISIWEADIFKPGPLGSFGDEKTLMRS